MRNMVACYVEVTIKSIKDAQKFLDKFSGQAYIPCGDIDLCIEVYKNKNGEFQRDVSWRWRSMRGNIFAPYLVDDDPAYCLYLHRKYVNAWQKSRNKYR